MCHCWERLEICLLEKNICIALVKNKIPYAAKQNYAVEDVWCSFLFSFRNVKRSRLNVKKKKKKSFGSGCNAFGMEWNLFTKAKHQGWELIFI